MNPRRAKLATQAFGSMDKNKNGKLDIEDIRGTYTVDKHPDFIAGKKTEDDILFEFLDTFE